MSGPFQLQIVQTGTSLLVSDWALANSDETQSFLAPYWKNFQCAVRRMGAKLGHCLALRGEGRLHGPHDLTVVGVDKRFRRLALLAGPIFVVEIR
jgi:hypothetical protein